MLVLASGWSARNGDGIYVVCGAMAAVFALGLGGLLITFNGHRAWEKNDPWWWTAFLLLAGLSHGACVMISVPLLLICWPWMQS